MAISEFLVLKRNSKVSTKLSSIKKACQISDQAFLFLIKELKVGMTEKLVANLIDSFIKKQGASLAFPTIVASGPNGYFLHNKPQNRKLKKHEPVILDFGAKFNNYCSDISRTIFISWPKPFWYDIYKLVLETQNKIIGSLRKERSGEKLDYKARHNFAKHNLSKNFIHTLGHSLGKKPHDGKSIGPNSKYTLKVGDVFTIEPGLYFKGRGGVRIEDDFVITKNDFKSLSFAPKKLKEVVINEK